MSEQITTKKAIVALPIGSVVMDRHGYPWHKGTGSWACSRDGGVIELIEVMPLTLLHRPDSPTPPQDATVAGDGDTPSSRPAEPSIVALDAAEEFMGEARRWRAADRLFPPDCAEWQDATERFRDVIDRAELAR